MKTSRPCGAATNISRHSCRGPEQHFLYYYTFPDSRIQPDNPGADSGQSAFPEIRVRRRLRAHGRVAAAIGPAARSARSPVRPARTAPGTAGAPPADEEVAGQRQDRRPGYGRQPGGEVEEPVPGDDVEQFGCRSRPAPRPRTIHAIIPVTDSWSVTKLTYG
jgi:hypothetical protein